MLDHTGGISIEIVIAGRNKMYWIPTTTVEWVLKLSLQGETKLCSSPATSQHFNGGISNKIVIAGRNKMYSIPMTTVEWILQLSYHGETKCFQFLPQLNVSMVEWVLPYWLVVGIHVVSPAPWYDLFAVSSLYNGQHHSETRVGFFLAGHTRLPKGDNCSLQTALTDRLTRHYILYATRSHKKRIKSLGPIRATGKESGTVTMSSTWLFYLGPIRATGKEVRDSHYVLHLTPTL